MEYRIHPHRYDNFDRYYNIVREAMTLLGHTEVKKAADINFFNHIHTFEDNCIIVKPTAPTSKHFALDNHGYANTSEIAYEEPIEFEYVDMDWSKITKLIDDKANKWDDSILLKWRKEKQEIPKDHILVIGQMPLDETVKGFGFGDHWKKLCEIVEFLNLDDVQGLGPIVVKLHPSMKGKIQQIKNWREAGITVIDGYISIHDILPKTRVAVVENSTAGIECLMHQVPVISHGWPEYHWVTAKMQTLPHLQDLIYNMNWHDVNRANQFVYWYINYYLCTDINSTVKRLSQLI